MPLTPSEISYSHLADDYEKLRTSQVRSLRQTRDLLIDALHAIRNGRLEVADEFVDRSADTLSAMLRHLESQR